jgi:thiosulfate reductase cytochrome b subunit
MSREHSTARSDLTMETDSYQEAIKAAIRYTLLIVIVTYIISGLGITQHQIIGPLTLGVLTTPLALRIHDFLLAPFVVLLVAHIIIGPITRAYSHSKEKQQRKTIEHDASS